MEEPTESEIAEVVRILSRLEPGYLPLPLFLAIARLTATSVIEVVPLRVMNGNVQVLLTKRPDDDPNWPGMLHTPGTVVRSSDTEGDYSSAFKRILEDELASVELDGQPQFVTSLLHKVKRGMEDANVYYVVVKGSPTAGEFYDVDTLPENVVDTQIDMIHLAASKLSSLLR
jgi:hypothetical protein